MAGNKRGGRRAGAGRPSLQKGKKRVNWTISTDTRSMIQAYTSRLNLSESDFVDNFMARYIPQCSDFFRCPRCGTPMAWAYGNPLTDTRCPCGYEYPASMIKEINRTIIAKNKKDE